MKWIIVPFFFVLCIRYLGKEDFKEELVCCINLPRRDIGSEIFRLLNRYCSEKEIDWGSCVVVCTDEAANMTAYRLGVFAKTKEAADKEKMFTHWRIHRKHLAAKKLPTDLKNVLNNVVKTFVDFRSWHLNSRIFKTLYKNTDLQHLLHAAVRWLLRGQVLLGLVELKGETRVFLETGTLH